jgi:hypothetical protein
LLVVDKFCVFDGKVGAGGNPTPFCPLLLLTLYRPVGPMFRFLFVNDSVSAAAAVAAAAVAVASDRDDEMLP